tara:strand:- start:4635 stop:4790 length:156 start_codon:yes stop_codon:yes gene_type:complete
MSDTAEVRELGLLLKVQMARGVIYFVNGEQENNPLSVARELIAGKKVHSIE